MFDILVGIVVFQYLLIAAVLIDLRRRNTPGQKGNSFLAIFFCLVAANLIDAELMRNGFYYLLPRFALLEDSLVLTYGPVLYFYTLSIVRPDRKGSWKDLLHGVPAAALLSVILVFYTIPYDVDRVKIIDAIVHQRLPMTSALLSFGIIFAHFFMYLSLALKEIGNYHHSLEDRYASLENVNVSWLSFTLKVLGLTFVISWLATFFGILQNTRLSEIALVAIVIILLYYINRLVIKALKDPRLFTGVDKTPDEAKGHSRQALDPTEIIDIRAKLDGVKSSKLYSDPGLTLDKLSDQLKIPSRKLSQFLNEILEQSFFDYINSLRIEEAKSILIRSQDPKMTVQEVMYQVGFNSKSSFNVLFKEKTGRTPSQFRKSGSSS